MGGLWGESSGWQTSSTGSSRGGGGGRAGGCGGEHKTPRHGPAAVPLWGAGWASARGRGHLGSSVEQRVGPEACERWEGPVREATASASSVTVFWGCRPGPAAAAGEIGPGERNRHAGEPTQGQGRRMRSYVDRGVGRTSLPEGPPGRGAQRRDTGPGVPGEPGRHVVRRCWGPGAWLETG